MKTSFIIICDDLNNVKMPITPVMGFFTCLGYQINNITLLCSDFLETELMAKFCDNNIIFAPFDDENCLTHIKSTIDKTAPLVTYSRKEFGYVASSSNKRNYILNKGLTTTILPMLKTELGDSLDNRFSCNYKIFDLNYTQCISIANSIAQKLGVNFCYFYDCGDLLLHFDHTEENTISQIDQTIYQALGNKIYIDSNISLYNALEELMTVQRRRLLILDYAGCDFLKNGVESLIKSRNIEFLEKREFKNLDKARQYIFDNNFDILLVISRNSEGYVLAFIDEIKSKNVQISFKSFQKYGRNGAFYLFLYNILEKFRKNTW